MTRNEAKQIKNTIDEAVYEFVTYEIRLSRRKNTENGHGRLRMLRRGITKGQWPYTSLRAFLSDRAYDRDQSWHTDGFNDANHRDKYKDQAGKRFEKKIPSFPHETIESIDYYVREGQIKDGTEPILQLLNYAEDRKGEIIDRILNGGSKIIVALHEKDDEESMLLICGEVRADISKWQETCAIVLGLSSSLLTTELEALESSPSVVLIPAAESFDDLDRAIDWIAARRIRAVLFCSQQAIADGMPAHISEVIPIPGMPQQFRDVLYNVEESLFHAAEGSIQPEQVAILRTIPLFTSLRRRAPIWLLRKLHNCTSVVVTDTLRLTEELLALNIEPPEGADVAKLQDFDNLKVTVNSTEWAKRYVRRRVSGEQLYLGYRQIIQALDDPSNEAHRRLARNLFKSFAEASPPRLRLARRLFKDEGGRIRALIEKESETDVHSRNAWANTLAWMGEFRQAHNVFLLTQRDGLSPDVDIANARVFSERLRVSGRAIFFDRAKDILDELSRLMPSDETFITERATVYEELGLLHMELSNYSEALEYFMIANKLWPRRRYIYYLAEIQHKLGRPDESQKLVKELEGKLPKGTRRPMSFEFEAFSPEDLSKRAEQMLKIPEPHIIGLVELAVRLLGRGHLNAAEPLLKRAEDLDPDNVYVQQSLGTVAAERGDFQSAARSFDNILDHLSPDSTRALSASAKAHLESWLDGNKLIGSRIKRARTFFKRYLKQRWEGWRLLPSFTTYARCILAQNDETRYLKLNKPNSLEKTSTELAMSYMSADEAVRLNLAARIASGAKTAKGFELALGFSARALKCAEEQVATCNTKALVLCRKAEWHAAQGDDRNAKIEYEAALNVYRETLCLDETNAYTLMSYGTASRKYAAKNSDQELEKAGLKMQETAKAYGLPEPPNCWPYRLPERTFRAVPART